MEKLNSVLKSRELRLALNVLALSVGAYFARSEGELVAVVFVAIALWLYFSQIVNITKFWFSYGLNLAFLFFFPWEGSNLIGRLFVVIGYGFVAGLILGAKNMVFIRRHAIYQLAIFLLLGEMVYFFFSGILGGYAILASSLGFLLLTKEYYLVLAVTGSKPMLFYAMVSALIYSQFLWVVSILPILNSGKIALALTLILLMNDIFSHHIDRNLSSRIIFRNVSIAVVSSAFIIALSAGKLG